MKPIFCFLVIAFISLLVLGCKGTSTTPQDPDTPIIDLCNNNVLDTGEIGIDCGGICSECITVDVSKEITITDLSVVNSETAKTGPLSFGKLLEKMADNDSHYKQIVLSLFGSWDVNQQINGFNIPARPIMKSETINRWKLNQGIDLTTPDENWQPDPSKAPFRLLAITNRVDLASLAQGKAGEGRLTFGQDDQGGNDFTLIFEYKLEGSSELDVIKWTKKWHKLSSLQLGSPEYLDSLSSIVSSFTRSGNDLSQLRTNSVIGGPWEFREFVWDSGLKLLKETTRKQNPDVSLNSTPDLFTYLNDPTIKAELLNGEHEVPLAFNASSILSGNTTYNSDFTWTAPGADPNVLKVLDFISCTGCHGGFTPGGIGFTHIKPRSENSESEISDFLFVDSENRRKDNIVSILNLPNPLVPTESVLTTPEIQAIKELLDQMEGIPTVH